ncbi:MAG: superoxide dismutase [Acidimicrobiia bacterium]|nr:superoxide dismutase [Acidimicrobiia bacterium]
MSVYTLPDLPYDYGALEPHLSAEIVELHHDKHHAAYVKGANDTLEQLAEHREKGGGPALLNALEKNLAFHVSGHALHSLFWQNMSPDGGGEPDGALATRIEADLGGYQAMRAQVTAAAMGVQGSGWAALAYEPLGDKVVVTQIYDHQSNTPTAGTPLLVLDMWEHAFYLQYKNVKADWVEAFWNIVNWNDVATRLSDVS